MNNKTKEQKLVEIINSSNNNLVIIDNIIKYIELELHIELYKTSKTNTVVDKVIDIRKKKATYKQYIGRLLNHVDTLVSQESRLLKEVKKGDDLLRYKKALTVGSPSFDNEGGGFNNGYKPNTQESKLLAVEEEIKKQQKRIIDYELFCKSFEEHKKLLKQFIELSPNNTGVDVLIRHYIYGEKFCDIARKLNYTDSGIFQARARIIEDLALILLLSL